MPVVIAAAVAKPVAPVEFDDDGLQRKLPVVVFSHGMCAMRTTYAAFCCDLASYGYVVAAIEHRDGSACVASYSTKKGQQAWLPHSHVGPLASVPMEIRRIQLRHRVLEVQQVLDLLERVNDGDISASANLRSGRASMNPSLLKGCLDLDDIALAGHSFGGATAVCAAGVDKRVKCVVAMDAWWEPFGKDEYERLGGGVPLLCVDSVQFDWPNMRRMREEFFKLRCRCTKNGLQMITMAYVIKGSAHANQSDFPLVLPWLTRKMRMAGSLDANLNRLINSKLCLDFLRQHLKPPGTEWLAEIDMTEKEATHLEQHPMWFSE
ncbi:hypothetical protein CBR_g12073 [Chara braunii]|uniref:1-alkyl-2-acetylglycerophosphocholine esterase n=1 Tax=Chara braunii TaxID=69332 RepID=A0A388KR51_CHABU|nr:hypothetical protein CBR_g12073 [Chara braunii]|eukprot:GBG72502.1 hypothetical protein CBR_g12073 [Chara braunii]